LKKTERASRLAWAGGGGERGEEEVQRFIRRGEPLHSLLLL
jgi:hypothetical protein